MRQKLIIDAPPDNRGKGKAFSPTDLLATALGICAVTIMGIAAREHGFSIDGTSIGITKIMASNSRRVAELIVEFQFPDNAHSDKERRIIELSAKFCPVFHGLHPYLKKNSIQVLT